jgi:hypothetical protein
LSAQSIAVLQAPGVPPAGKTDEVSAAHEHAIVIISTVTISSIMPIKPVDVRVYRLT